MTTRLIGLLPVLTTLMAPAVAEALDWERLWRNDDQIAADRMRAGDHATAARLFDDRHWQAAAWYRAGEYQRAAEALKGLDDIEAHYNRGNALAKSGDLDGAMAAYETVLDREPGHADARHNLEVIRHLVRGGSGESGESEKEKERQEGEASAGGASGGRNEEQPEPRTGSGQDSSPDEGDARADAQGTGESGRSNRDTRTGDAGDADAGSRGEPGSMQSLPDPAGGAPADSRDPERTERRASMDQWLRRVPDDPGGLLRRKFRYQYSRRGHDDLPGGESW